MAAKADESAPFARAQPASATAGICFHETSLRLDLRKRISMCCCEVPWDKMISRKTYDNDIKRQESLVLKSGQGDGRIFRLGRSTNRLHRTGPATVLLPSLPEGTSSFNLSS
jgi:hypothetical protein